MNLRRNLIASLIGLTFVAAGCDLFGTPLVGGIIKSTNGGSDWQFSNKIENSKATLQSISVSSLVFDPANPDRIFAAAFDNGAYKSENGGQNWTQILSRFNTYDFAVDPNNPNTLYAAGYFDSHGRLLKSTDGGKSWVEIFNEASTKNAVRSLALNPGNPQEIIISLTAGTIIKSRDGGQTWQLLQNYNDRINRIRWQGSAVYVVLQNSGLLKSTDGGVTFQILSKQLQAGNRFIDAVSGNQNQAAANTFNFASVSVLNPNLIYLTGDTGLFRSQDGGQTWAIVKLPVRQTKVPPLAVYIAPSSDNIVYASGGSIIYKTTDGGTNWQTQDTHSNGLISTILVHPQLSQVVYGGIFAQ